jgi:hypothetical protein
MDKLMEPPGAELHPEVDADEPFRAAEDDGQGARGFGADAVPLRRASERNAEIEGQERLRMVAHGSRRRSPRRRLARLGVLGGLLVGLVVLAVVHIGGGTPPAPSGGVQDRLRTDAGDSRPAPVLGVADPGKPKRTARARWHHPATVDRRRAAHRDRKKHAVRHRRVRDRPTAPESAQASPTPPEPEVAPAPEPEVTSAPEPEPVPTAEPEVTSAPEVKAAPEPTSSQEGKTTERSQVEAQFGFQK